MSRKFYFNANLFYFSHSKEHRRVICSIFDMISDGAVDIRVFIYEDVFENIICLSTDFENCMIMNAFLF